MTVYKFGEYDIANRREEDGLVSIDGTVFVSDGGYFCGIVQDHGTLIIRGGEADVIIGQHGKVLTHGGVLRAIVKNDGQLEVSEGCVRVKEEGGFVRVNEGYQNVSFDPSVIENATISQFASAHKNTVFLNCHLRSTGSIIMYEGSEFRGYDNKFAHIDGKISGDGNIRNVYVGKHGEIGFSGKGTLRRCYLDGGHITISNPDAKVRGIIVNKGTLKLLPETMASYVTVNYKGKLVLEYRSIASIYYNDGKLYNHGKIIYLKK